MTSLMKPADVRPIDRYETLKYISKTRRRNSKLRARVCMFRSISICGIFVLLFSVSYVKDFLESQDSLSHTIEEAPENLMSSAHPNFSSLRHLLELEEGGDENGEDDGGENGGENGDENGEEIGEEGDNDKVPDECKPKAVKDRCAYVMKYSEGVCDDEGYIPYTKFYFCTVGDSGASPLAVIFLVVIVLYYFFLIAGVADDYFSPTMANISEVLKLPHNFAGVTFLAFGNGSPDVFSSLAALTGSSPDLGLAGIMGAGVFVPTFVIGAVILAAPDSQLTRRPLLRDAGFLLTTVVYILILVLGRTITIVGALMLLVFYVIYVGTVMIGRIIYLRMKGKKVGDDKKTSLLDDTDFDVDDRLTDSEPSRHSSNRPSRRSSNRPYKISMASSMNYQPVFQDEDDDYNERHLPSNIRLKYLSNRGIAREIARQRRKSVASVLLGTGLHGHKHSMYHTGSRASKLPSRFSSRASSRNQSYAIGESSSRNNSMFLTYGADFQQSGNRLAVPGMTMRGIHRELGDNKDTTTTPTPKRKMTAKDRWRSAKIKIDAMRRFQKSGQGLMGDIRMDTFDNTIQDMHYDIEDDIEEDEDEHDSKLLKCMGTFTHIIGVLFEYLWKFTIPLVSTEEWDRWLNITHCVTVPAFVLIAMGQPAATLGGLPIMMLTLILGIALAFFVWFRSRDDPDEPIFVLFFLIMAFLSGALWVYIISQELVSLLGTLGIISGINQAVLGLTVLAWGNSVPDTISNTAVAKLGYPGMATGAAFGEPLLNHLFALGIAMTINTIKVAPEPFDMPRNGNILLCAIFEIFAMISHIIVFPLVGFKLKKPYAYYLFVLYIVFLILNLLNTVGVIPFG